MSLVPLEFGGAWISEKGNKQLVLNLVIRALVGSCFSSSFGTFWRWKFASDDDLSIFCFSQRSLVFSGSNHSKSPKSRTQFCFILVLDWLLRSHFHDGYPLNHEMSLYDQLRLAISSLFGGTSHPSHGARVLIPDNMFKQPAAQFRQVQFNNLMPRD